MQQTTINLPSSNPLRAATGLARQIALPGEYAPERFPSFPALERTAVMGFNQPATVSVPASTAVKMGLYRQAAFPFWADYTTNRAHMQVTYATTSVNTALATNRAFMLMEPCVVNWTINANTSGSFTGYRVGVSTAPTTPFPFTYPIFGVDDALSQVPFVYVPPNHTVSFTFWNPVPPTNVLSVNLEVEYWTAPGDVRPGQFSISNVAGDSGSNLILAVSAVGYWVRPKSVDINTAGVIGSPAGFNYVTTTVTAGAQTYTGSATTPGSISIAATNCVGYMPIVGPSEFQNSTLPWASTRVTAAAFLGTNVSQVVNKGGTILGGRVSPNVRNSWEVDAAYLNSLHPAEKAWLPLELGLYTYAPPSTDLATFSDFTLNVYGSLTYPPNAPVFRLDNTSLVNIAYVTASGVAETLAITVSWHLEFRTSSALFQIALSGVQLESLHQAQLALAHAGFFFENFNHKGLLSKITSFIGKYYPKAEKAMAVIAPPIGGAMTAARLAYTALRGKKGKRGRGRQKAPRGPTKVTVPQSRVQMPTTTAKKSGFDGPRKKRQGGLDMYLKSRGMK